MTTIARRTLGLAVLLLSLSVGNADATDPATRRRIESSVVAATDLPIMTVYRSPTCDCCRKWVAHLEVVGFPVDVVERVDVQPVKAAVGVPAAMASCHTAKVGGYFVEGHVPAEDIKRLLVELPAARGLAPPGIPSGSPGMEHPSGRISPYTVQLVAPDGSVSDYSKHGGRWRYAVSCLRLGRTAQACGGARRSDAAPCALDGRRRTHRTQK